MSFQIAIGLFCRFLRRSRCFFPLLRPAVHLQTVVCFSFSALSYFSLSFLTPVNPSLFVSHASDRLLRMLHCKVSFFGFRFSRKTASSANNTDHSLFRHFIQSVIANWVTGNGVFSHSNRFILHVPRAFEVFLPPFAPMLIYRP